MGDYATDSGGSGRSCFGRNKCEIAFGITIKLLVPVIIVLTNLNPWLKDTISNQQLKTCLSYGVISDATVCNELGARVIKELNGNAMDAAIATVLCVGVTNFHSTSIGGGSFLMHYNKTSKKVSAYNNREAAPGAARSDMFKGGKDSKHGGLVIAVPGEVAGLFRAHSKHGRLPWPQLITPVEEMLRKGRTVTKPLADAIESKYNTVSGDERFSELNKSITNPETGKPYIAGDIIVDEKLANTMKRIAEDPMSFYKGSLAKDIVTEIKEEGSKITEVDLSSYQVSEPDPISMELKSSRLRLYSMPPPASGAILGFILNVLDGYEMRPDVKDTLDSYANFHHRMIEAFKFGYAKRSALGDHKSAKVSEAVAKLNSSAFADQTRLNITDDKTHDDIKYYGSSSDWQKDDGTTHVSLVDSEGNAVVITSTINKHFGSLIKGKTTGILYNNEMADFNTTGTSEDANSIQPGKRPMSSAAPVIVTDQSDELRYIGGGAGSTKIISAVASVLARMIYLNQNVKEATDAFRLHHERESNAIQYQEEEMQWTAAQTVREALEQKGHEFIMNNSKSVVEFMQHLPDGTWQLSGDYRKSSEPACDSPSNSACTLLTLCTPIIVAKIYI